jgi:hypothetical protein
MSLMLSAANKPIMLSVVMLNVVATLGMLVSSPCLQCKTRLFYPFRHKTVEPISRNPRDEAKKLLWHLDQTPPSLTLLCVTVIASLPLLS